VAEEPIGRRRAELEQPLVVGAHARELERAVVAEHARALLRDARIEELRMNAVGIHVGEARRGLPVTLADRLVREAARAKAEVARAGGGHEPDRPDPRAVVEEPRV